MRKAFEVVIPDYHYRKQNIKCRTEYLPDDQGFLNIISNGMPGSFMPLHEDELSPEEKETIKEYIKTFSYRSEEEARCVPVADEKPAWIGSADSVEKSKKIFREIKCGECCGHEDLLNEEDRWHLVS